MSCPRPRVTCAAATVTRTGRVTRSISGMTATLLRRVVDAMPYVAHTGGQWRYLPAEFGSWTRVWSQFRRRSHATVPGPGSWPRCTRLHAASRGLTFHDKGGPYGRTKGAPSPPSRLM
ncbi:MAG: transposase [Nocardioidaceae bacterium]